VNALLDLPLALARTANILLTTEDAVIGATPRDVVWTHRKTTLYRYRSTSRRHPVPVLLVFALINRPDIFDLRPGNSFVEFLLAEGFDVFLVDWGVPGPEDDDQGLAEYLDELHGAVRESGLATRLDGEGRPTGTNVDGEVTLVGWCIGAALCAMYTAQHPDGAVRNAVLLTMPVDTSGTTYRQWVNRPSFDLETILGTGGLPGDMIDVANKMLKPVTNFVTTRRRLFEQVLAGTVDRVAYQSMAKWVSDNPPFAALAYRQWIRWMYQQNRLAAGTMRLRGQLVDFAGIRRQGVLVVTADADHIAPREGTLPFLSMVGADDLTHFDRKGGHIGLMAGSKARRELWPDLAAWLAARSQS
jgi:polyhydroxyalkanoate synthase subunit PhaC